MTLHLRFDDSRPRHLASVCSSVLSLREVVRTRLDEEGVPHEQVLKELKQFRALLRSQNRLVDEDVVLDVMDFLVGFSSSRMSLAGPHRSRRVESPVGLANFEAIQAKWRATFQWQQEVCTCKRPCPMTCRCPCHEPSTPERGAAPGAFLRLDVPPSTVTLSDVKPDPHARLGAAGRLPTKRGRSA